MSNTLLDGLICSTVFTPGVAPAACASAYMRNCYGTTTAALPDTVIAGNYQVNTPDDLDFQNISITARAYDAAGSVRKVTVVPTQILNGGTNFDIYVRDDAGALTEDFVNCEVTVTRLPL